MPTRFVVSRSAMNHITKTFLARAQRKIIPFQMMKTNYGFSSADGDDVSRELAAVNADLLGFRLVSLPESASFVAIAFRVPRPEDVDQSLRVTSIGTSPPGETELALQLQPGETYQIYVLSNKYTDGFINQVEPNPGLVAENVTALDSTDPRLFRREFRLASATDRIEVVLTLQPSTQESEWYPYNDKYDKDFLLWADPTPLFNVANGVAPSDNYSYLAYERNYLSAILADTARAMDLYGPDSEDYLRDAIRLVDNGIPAAVESLAESLTGQDIPDFVITNYYLNQALRGARAKVYTTVTHEKWNSDPRLLANEQSTNSLNRIVKAGGYDTDVFDLIGRFPSDGNANDPIKEYRMRNSLEQHLAGLAVIMQYVVGAYETRYPTRSFANDFQNDASIGFGVLNRRNELEQAVSDALVNLYAQEREKSAPVLFEEGYEVYELLKANQADAESLLSAVADRVSKYERALTVTAPAFANLFVSPFDRNIEDKPAAFASRVRAFASSQFTQVWKFANDRLQQIDRDIAALGDFTFVSPPQGENDGEPKLAHEATLQNIRFLRNLLESMRDDLWTQNSNFGSFIIDTVVNLRDEAIADLRRSNTVVNLTNTLQVENNQIEVLYRSLAADGAWQQFNGQLLDLGNGAKALDVSFLRSPGQYVFMIRPVPIDIVVKSIPAPGVIQTPSLDDYQSKNYFYGWNIEFAQAGTNGIALGEQRMIVGSDFSPGASSLVVSPNITDRPDFTVDINAKIWPNTFAPILVDLEITEHNAETLAYATYAKREFNVNTGVVTLYDFNGNVYKQWTVGERVLENEDFSEIEFRDPIE